MLRGDTWQAFTAIVRADVDQEFQAAVTPVPDSRGLNLYRADPMLARLAALYLPADLRTHLAPHLDRLGALAGGRLDELAGQADRNPPVLHQRRRSGEDGDWIEKHPAYRGMEQLAFGDHGLAALSHRGGVLGWPAPMPPAAKYLLTYLFVQAEFGLMCPVSMTDSLTRTLRKFGDPALVARYLPALTSQDLDVLSQGAMFMTEQGGGVGCGGDRGAGGGGGRRHLALVRRQVVLLERRCRPGDGAGAAGRCAARHARAEPVPAAAGAAGWAAQRLSDRAVEGQAGHPLDGQRRDHAARARPRSWSASPAPGSARWRT